MGLPSRAAIPMRRKLVQAGLLAVTMLAALSLYLAVEYWRGGADPVVTQTAWDKRISFQPAWVWVYLFPYLLAPVLAMLLSWDTLLWYLRRGIVVVLISIAIFAIFPTRTVRPSTHDLGTGLTAQLYQNMARIDGPAANAAPSLHVSLTALLAWALLREFRRRWMVILIVLGTVAVWASTLFTWQHHLIDVLTGALLGTLAAWPWVDRRKLTSIHS